jgi:hypothetical protein
MFRPLFPDVEIVRSEKLPWGAATMATTEPASSLARSARSLLLLLLTRHQFDEFSAVNPEEHCSYRPARFDLPVEGPLCTAPISLRRLTNLMLVCHECPMLIRYSLADTSRQSSRRADRRLKNQNS